MEELEEALQSFVGEIEQKPPAYSAIKVKGRRAYELARKGEEVDLEPRLVTVKEIELLTGTRQNLWWMLSVLQVRIFVHWLMTWAKNWVMRSDTWRLTAHKEWPLWTSGCCTLRRFKEAFEQGDWYKFVIPR